MGWVEYRPNPPAGESEHELLAKWLEAIGQLGVPPRVLPIEVFADVVSSALGVGHRPAPTLRRFGRRLGADGWILPVLSACVGRLTSIDSIAAARFDHFDTGIALAEGWTEGARATAGVDGCLDPLTGLVRLPVLRIRLEQVYDHCAALGLPVDQAYRLLVVDCADGGHPPFVRDATHVVAAEHLRRTFTSGETLCATDSGRLLALAATSRSLPAMVTSLIEGLRATPLLQQVAVLAWIELLPADPCDISAFLADVSG